jgi:ABC-type glutathione transport system ATPase component
MALVEVSQLVKIYPLGESIFGGGKKGEVRAVDDVSLEIAQGETLGLVGESGSGKSTLGRLILRLIEPTSGTVRFNAVDVLAASRGELRRLRRDMQIIFQDPFGSLDPRMTVEEIVAEPFEIHGLGGSTRPDSARSAGRGGGTGPGGSAGLQPGEFARNENRALAPASATASSVSRTKRGRVIELLRATGLDESALRRYPHEFSGGQRQRIGIARALALRPKFIVCDEPVSALDVSVGAQIVNLLAKLQREFGLTYLFISHSMPVVRYLATRIAVMQKGKIVEIGETEAITTQPQHPYTKSLLEATPEMIGN